MADGIIQKVSGPLVVATGLTGAKMYEVVRVGEDGLFGEIIEVRAGRYSIQVYEDTGGLGPGAPVVATGQALSVELGPGMMTSIYDGVQRPLEVMVAQQGDFILRGADLPAPPAASGGARMAMVRSARPCGASTAAKADRSLSRTAPCSASRHRQLGQEAAWSPAASDGRARASSSSSSLRCVTFHVQAGPDPLHGPKVFLATSPSPGMSCS